MADDVKFYRVAIEFCSSKRPQSLYSVSELSKYIHRGVTSPGVDVYNESDPEVKCESAPAIRCKSADAWTCGELVSQASTFLRLSPSELYTLAYYVFYAFEVLSSFTDQCSYTVGMKQ